MRNTIPVLLTVSACAWAVLALGGCATTSAGVAEVQSTRWQVAGAEGRRFDTLHTRLFSTIGDRGFERALPRLLEDAYAAYARGLPPSTTVESPLTFHVVGDEGAWRRFVARRFGGSFAAARNAAFAGFTDDTGSYLFYQGRSPTIAAAAHEGFHQYLLTRFDVDLPLWLEEGMACECEGFKVSGDRLIFTPGRNSFRTNTLCEARNTRRLLPFDALLAMDHGKLGALRDPKDGDRFYAQAWALVASLRHSRHGAIRREFERLLADIADGSFNMRVSAAGLGKSRPGTDAVLNAYFSESASAVEPAYLAFIDGICGR